MSKFVKWLTVGGAFGWLAREATHIGHHLAVPQTVLLCLVPPTIYCLCRWCRKSVSNKETTVAVAEET